MKIQFGLLLSVFLVGIAIAPEACLAEQTLPGVANVQGRLESGCGAVGSCSPDKLTVNFTVQSGTACTGYNGAFNPQGALVITAVQIQGCTGSHTTVKDAPGTVVVEGLRGTLPSAFRVKNSIYVPVYMRP